MLFLGIKEIEKKSYHPAVDVYFQDNAWADTRFSCDWVTKTLKPAVSEGEEFVLLCDNLTAQVTDEFKSAVRNINGIVHFGVPGATDIWQPVDAGYGYQLKKLTAKAQDEWLELDENINLWTAGTLTASDRRILITQWVGEASEKLNSSDYDNFRWRCFEKTGCLLTADGSNDDKVEPEGFKDYKVISPLQNPGPEEDPNIEVPPPAADPIDAIAEDELFTLIPNEDQEASVEDENLERVDNEVDRIINHELVGRNIKGLYETGWHVGKLEYFNTKLQEYFVQFDDDSSDYLKKDDIDGHQVELIPEITRVSGSGRVHKVVDYRKLAGH